MGRSALSSFSTDSCGGRATSAALSCGCRRSLDVFRRVDHHEGWRAKRGKQVSLSPSVRV